MIYLITLRQTGFQVIKPSNLGLRVPLSALFSCSGPFWILDFQMLGNLSPFNFLIVNFEGQNQLGNDFIFLNLNIIYFKSPRLSFCH